jgi:superfamily II DNA/RNA helicase
LSAYLDDLRSQLTIGRVVVVVGAGLSIYATDGAQAATWTGLIHSGVDRVVDTYQGSELPPSWADHTRMQINSGDLSWLIAAAEQVADRLGGVGSGEYALWLRETVGELHIQPGRDDVYRHLLELGAPIATTNYDQLLEDATGFRSVDWAEAGASQRALRPGDKSILHLHGHWARPESVVLGSTSYSAVLHSRSAQALERALASIECILFVGVGGGLDDPNFSALRTWMSQTFPAGQQRHFQLCTAAEADQLKSPGRQREAIRALVYGENHSDLAGFLEGLTTKPVEPVISATVSQPDNDGKPSDAAARPWSPGRWPSARYAQFDDRTAREIWRDDPDWPIRYTHYATAIELASRALRADHNGDSDDAAALFDEMGDGGLPIWRGLDTFRRDRRAQGEFLARDVIAPAIAATHDAAAPVARVERGARAAMAWWVWFQAPNAREERRERLEAAVGQLNDDEFVRTMEILRWPTGLSASERVTPSTGATNPADLLDPLAAPWLLRLTVEIDNRLKSERFSPHPYDPERPFRDLVPPDLELVYMDRAEWLRQYREQLVARRVGALGISEAGLTDIYAAALPLIRPRLGRGRSMLVTGPTSTGKTDIGRTAAAFMVARRRKVIVLLPTKALVAQAAEEWTEFFSKAESSKPWRIVEASRDYPYNDERVAKGDFDILLAIPEKLNSYVVSGSRVMRQCGLIIVDELQYLATRQRGPNIEALLTSLRTNFADVPMLALSAPLTPDSVRHLQTWLQLEDSDVGGVVQTTVRPVPLARYAFDAGEWRARDEFGELRHGRWDLRAKAAAWRGSLPSWVARYEPAIALAVELLLNGEEALLGRPGGDHQGEDRRSTLMFVNGRAPAESLSRAIQDAVEAVDDQMVGMAPQSWRFGGHLSDEEAREWNQALHSLPDLPATNDVHRGLRTGVMYHTARLDADHRQLIEKAYAQRLIRILVATATLAVGVNLPADYVVVADIVDSAGGLRESDNRPRQRVLSVHEIGQRLGRCGRLGQSEGGKAFVMTLNGESALVEVSDTQIDDLLADDENALELDDESRKIEARASLIRVDRVFTALVDRETVGEQIASGLTDVEFSRLLLQDFARQAIPLTGQQIAVRAAGIYDRSLLKAEGSPPHDPRKMLNSLAGKELIGTAPDYPNFLRPSGIGRTIGFSNLPIENAETVARIAKAAHQGAGPLTLLCMAAEAPYVREMHWISLPVHQEILVDQLRQAVWTIIRCFVDPDLGATLGRDLADRTFLSLLGSRSLVGIGPIAEALRGRAADPTVNMADVRLTSHFRACIALLWLRGLPMSLILSFAAKNTEVAATPINSTRAKRARFSVYSADVKDLGERISYIINAASEIMRAQPHGGSHLLLKNLAESLQTGVPYQLAPLMWIEKPRIHRERLSTLFSLRTEQLNYDEIGGVLDALSTPPAGADARQRRAHQTQAFTPAERELIIEGLAHARGTFKGVGSMPPQLRNETLPSRSAASGSLEYYELVQSLGKMSRRPSLHLDDLNLILDAFGLSGDRSALGEHPLLTVHRPGSSLSFELVVAFKELARKDINDLAADHRIVLAFEGMTPGAEYDLRETKLDGYAAMTPSVFLSGLAFIEVDWRRYEGPEPEEELARRVLAFFVRTTGPISLSDLAVADVTSSLASPPPFLG